MLYKNEKLKLSKLNSITLILFINFRAESFVRYNALILKWAKDELRAVGKKLQKIMAINKIHYHQSDVKSLHI